MMHRHEVRREQANLQSHQMQEHGQGRGGRGPDPLTSLRAAVVLALSLLLFAMPATVQAQMDDADSFDADVVLTKSKNTQGKSVASVELQRLAEDGQFDQVLNTLRDSQDLGAFAPAPGLIEELQRHLAHKADRLAEQETQLQTHLDRMKAYAEVDHLESALRHAIDAHGLAKTPTDVLDREPVRAIVSKTEQAAKKAADEGRWIDAMAYYRMLDLLFEEHSPYSDPLKDSERHVRLLRLYAPGRLGKLHDVRELRRIAQREEAKAKNLLDEDELKRLNELEDGGNEPKPLVLGEETWQDKLANIDMSMLVQAIKYARGKHVASAGYKPLLLGSVDALLVMSNNADLAETFPAFNQPARVAEFRETLQAIKDDLNKATEKVELLEAIRVITLVAQLNNSTMELPEPVLVYEMTDGALGTLDDFTAMIWPHDKESFARNTQGKFYGVGIQISRRKDRLIVVSPLEDTPAARAGIKPQDIIATVDGRPTDSWTLEQAVREITGPKGTVVNLGIERGGEAELINYPIERDEIEIKSIFGWRHRIGGGWDYYIDPANQIGYVRMSQFVPNTAEALDQAVEQMEKDQGLNGLILDLRFNPGGLLKSAIEVVNRFISSGRIVSTVGPSGQRTTARARALRTYRPFPVVVLINQGSASASEIVSGALQDYSRAVIIGTRSFGKGSVQDLIPINGQAAYLKLTTQYYQLPNGRIIHRTPDAIQWGIDPDLEVRVTDQQVVDLIKFRNEADVLRVEEDLNPDEPKIDEKGRPLDVSTILSDSLDPQLEAALLVLKTQLTADRLAKAPQPAFSQ